MNKNKKIAILVTLITCSSINAGYFLKQKIKEELAANFIVEENYIYNFSSHTFTNCGKTGRNGPTLSECRASYSTEWDNNDSYFKMNSFQGYQQWVVPETALYTIKATGASGGRGYSMSVTGKGAIIQGDFVLNKGEIITILVG